MKTLFLTFVLSITLGNELTGQWLKHFPNSKDTFTVSDIKITEPNSVLAVGFKTKIYDNQLGLPQSDSIYIFETSNNGDEWNYNVAFFGKRSLITSLSVPTQNVWCISGLVNFNNGKVIKTSDHGQTWKDITPPVNPVTSYINLVNFYTDSIGVVTGDPESDEFIIYHTQDGGNSWTIIPNNQIPDAISDEFSSASQSIGDYIWFVTSYGRIYKSADRGYNWEVYQSTLNNLEGVSFSDTLNGIALYGFINLDFNTSPIIITSDGGQTWKTLDITPLGPKTGIFGASYIPNSSYIMLTTAKNSLLTGDFATWISPDRGETWQQISSGENIYTINFQDASTGWGGEGQQLAHPTRMFQYTGSPLVGLFSDKTLVVDWDVFPNPTADRVQVRVQEDKPTSYLLLVNDLQGKLILRKDWDGIGVLDLDLGASCPSGMYTVTLASKDGKAVRKLVVAR